MPGSNKLTELMTCLMAKGWEMWIGYGYFVKNKCLCYNGQLFFNDYGQADSVFLLTDWNFQINYNQDHLFLAKMPYKKC